MILSMVRKVDFPSVALYALIAMTIEANDAASDSKERARGLGNRLKW